MKKGDFSSSKYSNTTSILGQDCGDIKNQWVGCYSPPSTNIKCCEDSKTGYKDSAGKVYFSQYKFSCDYEKQCISKQFE